MAFLPRSKHLLISWLHLPSAVILEHKKIKSVIVSFVSPSICHGVMGPDTMILVFECWVLSQLFHSPLSLSSGGSLVPLCFLPYGLCPRHIWSYWYFSHQPLFQLVLHPAWHFTWCTKQGDNIQLWRSPFPIWNQAVVPCPVLTVASWLAYRFLKRQVQWSGIPISFRIFHSLLWSTQSKALA